MDGKEYRRQQRYRANHVRILNPRGADKMRNNKIDEMPDEQGADDVYDQVC
jgi:hypothetical protein